MSKTPNIYRKLTRLRLTTWGMMLIERISAALWMAGAWFLLFCFLWLMDLPSFFGSWGPHIATIIFFIGIGALLHKGFQDYRWPQRRQINRRLEQASHLEHRPISALEDSLANPGKTQTMSLWIARQKSVLLAMRKLRFAWPQPVLAARDPYAFRIGAAILFLAAIVITGSGWQDKIRSGLLPFEWSDIPGYSLDSASLTITPPEYTQREPLTIQGTDTEAQLQIPAGSTVKAKVTGGFGQPYLVMGKNKQPLETLGHKSFALEQPIEDGTFLTLQQLFVTRVKLPYSLVPDQPPTIAITGEPETLPRWELRFPLTTSDDYGVRDLTMSFDLDPIIEEAPIGKPVTQSRTVVTAPEEEALLEPVYDFTAHTWAGLPVVVQFTASDDLGQSAQTVALRVILPEREFHHPVAQKLIAMRKQLAWDPMIAAGDIAHEIEVLLYYPEDFQHDPLVYLALRSAASRLHYSPGEKTSLALIDLLWKTAIHIEDGDLTLALQRLRDAQKELEEALKDPNISDEELAHLTDNLKDALSEYFRELQRDLQKRMAEGENLPMMPSDMLSQMIQPEDFAQFFDQLESEALSGDRRKAQELLSQLQRMMEMLDPSFAAPMPGDMQAMMEGVNELQELIRRQEELLDQTRVQADQMASSSDYGETLPAHPDFEDMPPPPQSREAPSINTEANKTEQEALRFILGQLMQETGEAMDEIPETMGLAEQEMRGSSKQLGNNRPDQSVPHQQQAIEYLRQAMDSLSQQMMAMMQEMTGMAMGQGTDPLGRRHGQRDGPSWFPGSRVKIPDEAERKKIEEILKLLRKRSGEFDRPDVELDYYRRLLKQF